MALMRKQRGFFAIIAVLLIMMMGAMGVIIAYNLSSRASTGANEKSGFDAFYLAESGLEVAARLLIGSGVSSSATCATLTGDSRVTNASLLNGTFTATAVGGALYTGSSTLSSSINASSSSITLASTVGFSAHGRVRIDSEAIDYAAISGNQLIGLARGAGGTTAASHTNGASVTESVCLVDVQAGIPSIASPSYQRELQMAVEILSGSDAWIVGNRTGNNFVFERWNTPTASAWNDASVTDVSNRSNLNKVSLSSLTNGWAVGDVNRSNFIFNYWNGASWTAMPVSGACSGQNLYSVFTVSDSEAWAVGARYRPSCGGGGKEGRNSSYRYTIFEWDGKSWNQLDPSTSPSIPSDSSSNRNLNDISMIDSNRNGHANLGFAVGASGKILLYNGTSWSDYSSPTSSTLNGVSVVSTSEAWIVGASGHIYKWNGSSWSSFSSPTSTTLHNIQMVDSNGDGKAEYGWAVGNSGVIIYYNGSSWSTQHSSGNDLFDIGISSDSQAWAVGASGAIFMWDGSSWTSQSSPVGVRLNGISVVRGSANITGSEVGSWQQIFG